MGQNTVRVLSRTTVPGWCATVILPAPGRCAPTIIIHKSVRGTVNIQFGIEGPGESVSGRQKPRGERLEHKTHFARSRLARVRDFFQKKKILTYIFFFLQNFFCIFIFNFNCYKFFFPIYSILFFIFKKYFICDIFFFRADLFVFQCWIFGDWNFFKLYTGAHCYDWRTEKKRNIFFYFFGDSEDSP